MNLLPLEIFRQILGYNPWHFYGLADTGSSAKVPVTSNCNAVVKQYAWQSENAAGRAEILRAMETAETKLREQLGYAVAPRYVVADIVQYPEYRDRAFWNYGAADASGHRINVKLSEGHVQAVGVESITSLGNANVTFSDDDADGLNDHFVATKVTTETDPDRIALYFASGDRLESEPIGERWRIQPVSVSISGGTATIRGAAWLLVKPILYEGVAAAARDPKDANNFVTSVEVAIRKTDPNGSTVDTAQAKLVWETLPYPGCISGVTGTNASDPAAEAYAIARVGIHNGIAGLVHLEGATLVNGEWVSTVWQNYRAPERVEIRYLAGLLLEGAAGRKQMQKFWQTVVARFAMAELAENICGCATANRELHRWQFDVSRSAGVNDEQYQISLRDLDNPFGTRRGQVEAWKAVRQTLQVKGMTL